MMAACTAVAVNLSGPCLLLGQAKGRRLQGCPGSIINNPALHTSSACASACPKHRLSADQSDELASVSISSET